jgi:dihydropyrimidinase
MDYGIVNGRIYVEGKFLEGNLYIKDGKVNTISKAFLPCKKEYDAKGMMVLPGFIDPHVHFHLTVGANTSKDDFYTGSLQGVLGGVTTFIDFLDPIKQVSQLESAYKNRMELAENSVADYSFHTTIANPTDSARTVMAAGLQYGIPSVKLFTTYSNTDRRTYDDYIDSLLKVSRELKSRVVIHAENDHLIENRKDILVRDHEKSRPAISERSEIVKLAEMAKDKDGLLYIVHVSAGSSVEMLAKNYSKELKNKNIILESCPHYFLFNSESYKKEDGYLYTMTPPLREEMEQKLMNQYMEEISVIGTDHCPFDSNLKKQQYTSQIPMGVGGIRYSFITMYQLFGAAILPKFTEGPAKAYGLYPRKGTLLPGADADIVLFDDSLTGSISDSDSIYDGIAAKGRITDVFLRGKQIVENGSYLGVSQYKGEYLRRELDIN